MAKNGRCPAGQYYCYTDKKCKPIPAGFKVDPRGMLAKENGHSIDDESETKKNGNGNGSIGWQIRRETLCKTTRTNHKTKMWFIQNET
mgnify:CR=1 FL=1